MTARYIPPYHYNFDGTHCWQCALRSALEAFSFGSKWFDWHEIDRLSGNRKGLWSWCFETFANIRELNCEAYIISDYDFEAFAHDFEKANLAFYGPVSAAENLAHSDVEAERRAAQKMYQNIGDITFEKRSPTVEDIRRLILEGFLIIAWVNPNVFRPEKDYPNGHYILVYDVDGDELVFHDSGPRNEKPADRISVDTYMQASRSGGVSEGVFAIRPKRGVRG